MEEHECWGEQDLANIATAAIRLGSPEIDQNTLLGSRFLNLFTGKMAFSHGESNDGQSHTFVFAFVDSRLDLNQQRNHGVSVQGSMAPLVSIFQRLHLCMNTLMK